MKKLIGIIFCVILFFGIFFVWNKNDKEENFKTIQKPTIKIGVATPLSGMIHKDAEEMKKAMIYIVRNIKNPDINYELIFEDTAGQASKGISAAKKLIYVDKVNIIISHLSAVSKVISPIATKSNTLHIGTVLDASLNDNPTSFTFWTSADIKAQKYIKYLKKLGVKQTAVLVLNFATTEKLYEELANEAKDNNIQLVKYEFSPNQKDYRIDLLKLKEAKHPFITILMYPPELEIIYKQMNELGITTPISAIESFTVSNSPELFENIPYIDTNVGNTKIVEQIRTGAKTTGTTAFAQLYDILHLIDIINTNFYKRFNKLPNGKEMADMLIKLQNYKGVSGQVKINSDRRIQPEPAILKIINGHPQAAQ